MSLLSWHALRSIVRFSSREATRPDHELPDLRTRYLALPRRLAWRYVLSSVEARASRGGWTLEDESASSGQVHLTVRGRLRWCVCDVRVSLWPADERRIAVDVTSSSRGGGIDFGQNARNIRDFYRSLEMWLQHLPADGNPKASGIRDEASGRNAEGGIGDSALKRDRCSRTKS